ncbi:MAG: shikimate dehydrogenase [Bacteroidota bacterium]
MKQYGLIGFPLGHSYSKSFFQEKFEKLGLSDHRYELFEMESIKDFPSLLSRYDSLKGVNVTVPHKEYVIDYLSDLDESARNVGAVNVVKREGEKLVGYNTDYLGFKESLQKWIGSFKGEALILGTGGSSKAVHAALTDLRIASRHVSRARANDHYTYEDLSNDPEVIKRFELIINTTPLGMSPKTDGCPDIPYQHLTNRHYLFDLVYNPQVTTFMEKGKLQGAHVKNGLEMLKLQAECSWDIWNK